MEATVNHEDLSSEDETSSGNNQHVTLESSFHNPEDLVQFVLKGLKAKGLKKGIFFAPDPYVKFKIGPGFSDHNSLYLPHHGQNCRTTVVENTTEPIWPGQVLNHRQGIFGAIYNIIFFVAIHFCGLLIRCAGNRSEGSVCKVQA